MLLQVLFYPLLLMQVIIGVLQAAFIDYEILAFGFINYSALAADNEVLHSLFLEWHGNTALLLILLIFLHGLERSRKAFVE